MEATERMSHPILSVLLFMFNLCLNVFPSTLAYFSLTAWALQANVAMLLEWIRYHAHLGLKAINTLSSDIFL
jgi:hypothetical protein